LFASEAHQQDIRTTLDRGGGLEANVAALFPDSEDGDRKRIVDWLDRLTTRRSTELAKTIDELHRGSGGTDPIVVSLVRASQASILRTDLPEAARDANGKSLDSKTPAKDLASFFENKYRVGEEQPLKHISGHSLLRTASHTGLVARNALFGSLFKRVPLRASVLSPLKKVLGVPLWSTYWFATLGAFRELRVALAALSVFLILVAILFPAVLHGPGVPAGGVSKLWVTVFVLAPAGYLVFELLVMLMRLGRWAWLALALLALAAGLWLANNRQIELRSPIRVSQNHGGELVAGGTSR